MSSLWVFFLLFISALSLEPLINAPADLLLEDDTWREKSIIKLWKERRDMTHTPMFKYTFPGAPHVDIVFKNESASPTGSLKHRYAWALMMWALLEGKVKEGTHVYEASSGNTAASLAYMCRLVGVNFTAIVPDTLEMIKEHHITDLGGSVHKVPIAERLISARHLADENNGFFMNQFGNADKAEEFHESGNYPLESVNVFHEIRSQLEADPTQIVKAPHYMVHAAGTGGTISSIGRYVKKYGVNTQVVVADTQFSVYADYLMKERFRNESGADLWVPPGMAGIGYGPMGVAIHGETTSLDPSVIDRVLKIPDVASTAAMEVLRRQGIRGGTSSGINFVAALHLATKQSASNPPGGRLTVATILADPAHYYDSSYYNRTWIEINFAPHGGLKAYDCWIDILEDTLLTGVDPLQKGAAKCDFSRFTKQDEQMRNNPIL